MPSVSSAAVPSVSTEAVLPVSTEAVPSVSTEAVSSAAMPSVSTEAVPSVSTETVPSVSSAAVLSVSTEAMPSVSLASMLSVSTETMPSVSTEAMPSVLSAAVPSVSTETMPSVSTEAVPSVSTEAMPSMPSMSSFAAVPLYSQAAEMSAASSPSAGPPSTSCATATPSRRNDTSYVSPVDIMGIPQIQETESRRRGIKRGKTAVLTSSPYMKGLQSDLGRKRKKTSVTTQLFGDGGKGKKRGPGKGKGKATKKGAASERNRRSDDDVPCIYCTERYSESKGGEAWIMCQCCTKWAHEDCAGCTNLENSYICEFCME